MNKILTKVATLALGAAMAVGVGVAVGSKKVSAAHASTDLAITSLTPSDGTVSVSIVKGSGSSAPITGDYGVRMYTNNTMTVTSSSTITEISIEWTKNSKKDFATVTADVGSYTHPSAAGTGTWTGSANTIVFTVSSSGQIQTALISYTVDGGGGSTTYTITYDANGGSGTAMPDSVGSNPSVSACTYTAPEGKVFSEWNTSANGSGTSYAVGAKPAADLDLYAIWVKAPSYVEFVAGTDVGQSSAQGTGSTIVKGGVSMVTTSSRDTDAPYRFYASSTVTFSCSEKNIVGVEFTMNGSYSSSLLSADVGSYDSSDSTKGVWDGDAATVVFTASSQARCDSIKVTLAEDEPIDPTLDTLVILLNDATPSPATVSYSTTGLFYANDKDGNDIDAEWSSSNPSIFTVGENSSHVAYVTPVAPGTANLIATADGYNDGVFVLTINAGAVETVTVSGTMTKTSYSVGEAWSPAGLTVTANYEYGYHGDVTSSASWDYSPKSPAINVTSVVATATYNSVSGSSSAQTVTVTAAPHSGTSQDDAFTVAEARAKIDNTPGTTTWFATGIVSQIVTPYNTQYSNITFNFSDDGTKSSPQLQAYRCGGSEAANIAVGDIVIVSGKLKKYNSTYEFDTGCTIVSRTEPAVTKFTVTGNIDNGSINVSEIAQGATLEARVCGNLGYFYPDALTSVKVNGSDVQYTYNNGVVTITNVQGNVVITGACVACSALKSVYAMDKGVETGTFYAYYAGFLTGTGPVFMDGEYGIVVYNKDFNPSELVEKETVCQISGTTDNYNGLYQLKSATIVKASGEYPMPAAPVVYAVQGGETELFESRLTTVSGTVKSVEPNKSGQALWTSDTKVTMTVGAHDILCFAKANVFTTEEGAEIEAAVTSGDAITLKGFTGWHNGFQVTVNGRIQAADDYTAEEFAADLIQQTDAICVNYVDGKSSYSEFKVALEAVWSDLASDDKYPSLPQDQKDLLTEAERDESGTVVEQAMARYDFLTGKYSLSNFINGRTPIVPAGSYLPSYENNLSSSSSITIIVIVAVASMTLLGVTLVIRKRKMN